MMASATVWSASRSETLSALDEIRKHRTLGYDSEFDGLDISWQSTVRTANIHVFSIAVPGRAWVFPAAMLIEPEMKALLEDPTYAKAIHNQPVDAHAARNAGVKIRGGINTLDMARWVWPWRAKLVSGNFDLGSLAKWRLGKDKTEDFDALLGYDAQEAYTVVQTRQRCSCGEVGCRKKKPPHDGLRTPVEVEMTHHRKVRRIIPLADLKPGHALWDRYLAYAASDATLALELYAALQEDAKKGRPYPWTPGM